MNTHSSNHHRNAIRFTTSALAVLCALVLALMLAIPAQAKYGSYNSAEAYLDWTDANTLFNTANSVTTGESSPHGGYTQTSFKCVVCHSTHRA